MGWLTDLRPRNKFEAVAGIAGGLSASALLLDTAISGFGTFISNNPFYAGWDKFAADLGKTFINIATFNLWQMPTYGPHILKFLAIGLAVVSYANFKKALEQDDVVETQPKSKSPKKEWINIAWPKISLPQVTLPPLPQPPTFKPKKKPKKQGLYWDSF